MEAVVHQALRHVHLLHAERLEPTEVEDELVRDAAVPITYVEHARNFGEHNAVLTGWRHAKGTHIVNLDDDGQNPPAEAKRLWEHAAATGLDVVFGHYEVKQHSAWRNAGSWFTNRMTDWALDKPPGFYLSSFRCVTAFVARQVTDYAGPHPYLDGLLLQVTQRIGSIDVVNDYEVNVVVKQKNSDLLNMISQAQVAMVAAEKAAAEKAATDKVAAEKAAAKKPVPPAAKK